MKSAGPENYLKFSREESESQDEIICLQIDCDKLRIGLPVTPVCFLLHDSTSCSKKTWRGLEICDYQVVIRPSEIRGWADSVSQ